MPSFMLTGPDGKTYKLTTPDGVTHEDAERELARTMTHQAQQPNPAEPYLKGARDFGKGGVSDVLRGAGVQMPQASNAVGDLLKSDAANTAIGMVNPIKGASWYHGTPKQFSKFDLNEVRKTGEPDIAIALSSNRDLASGYAGKEGRVMEADTDFKNPMVVKTEGYGSRYNNSKLIEEAKSKGHDGIIFEFSEPSYLNDGTEIPPSREALAWQPGTIRHPKTGENLLPGERLPQPLERQRLDRPINQQTLDEMRAAPTEPPPRDPRPINPETLAEMRANDPLGNGPLSPIDPLSK